jgi:hypothetical protein
MVTFWPAVFVGVLELLEEQAATGKASAAAAAIAIDRRKPVPRRTVLFMDLPSLSWT